ncbi:hypothetical protein GF324_00650, partial [bacterium]|nr:hypothetical protein [bacterium]
MRWIAPPLASLLLLAFTLPALAQDSLHIETITTLPLHHQIDNVRTMVMQEGYLYVAANYPSLTIFQCVSDSGLAKVGELGSLTHCRDLEVSGGFLYYFDTFGNLYFISIENPAAPEIVNFIEDFGRGYPDHIAVDDTLLISSHGRELRLWDFRVPFAPVLLDTIVATSFHAGTVELRDINIVGGHLVAIAERVEYLEFPPYWFYYGDAFLACPFSAEDGFGEMEDLYLDNLSEITVGMANIGDSLLFMQKHPLSHQPDDLVWYRFVDGAFEQQGELEQGLSIGSAGGYLYQEQNTSGARGGVVYRLNPGGSPEVVTGYTGECPVGESPSLLVTTNRDQLPAQNLYTFSLEDPGSPVSFAVTPCALNWAGLHAGTDRIVSSYRGFSTFDLEAGSIEMPESNGLTVPCNDIITYRNHRVLLHGTGGVRIVHRNGAGGLVETYANSNLHVRHAVRRDDCLYVLSDSFLRVYLLHEDGTLTLSYQDDAMFHEGWFDIYDDRLFYISGFSSGSHLRIFSLEDPTHPDLTHHFEGYPSFGGYRILALNDQLV